MRDAPTSTLWQGAKILPGALHDPSAAGQLTEFPGRPAQRPVAAATAGGGLPWFQSLVARVQPTASAPLPALSPREVFLALVDPGTASRAIPAILNVFPDTHVYVRMPFAVVQGDQHAIGRLVDVEGIGPIFPLGPGFDEAETLVEGFDRLMWYEGLQRSGRPGDEGVIGGLPEGAAGYPIVRRRPGGGHELDSDDRQVLGTAPALMPVLTFSIGPASPQYPTRFDDPVNLATLAASQQQLVVVAAGNSYQRPHRETLSAWAEMDWVLAVGAADDEEGTTLAPYSSTGVAGQAGSWPDLVAWGASQLDPKVVGTSFAAPAVARLAMLGAAAILQFRHQHQRVSGGPVGGVRLIGAGFVDEFGETWFRGRPRLPAPALPVIGADEQAVAEVVEIAARAGIRIDVHGYPGYLRRMLLEAARPMPGYEPHQVGAGFVSEPIFRDWLAGFDGTRLVAFFGDRPPSSEVGPELARRKLFRVDELELLRDVVDATAPLWMYDYPTRRMAARV